MDSISGVFVLVAFWLAVGLLGLLYFLPAFVALKRKHPNETAILVLNIALGWTVLGWVGALVWACTAVSQNRKGDPA